MAKSFSLDMTALIKALEQSPEAAGLGAKQALDDIKDDWVREARDVAPLDTGNLRKQINGDVDGAGLDSQVIVTANAVQSSNGKWKRFNYAYYIHEGHMAAAGKKLQTAGTVEQFLDDSANEEKWQGWLEDEVNDALKKAGW